MVDPRQYRVKLAETEEERQGAQRLRYRVFVEEMGAEATAEQHALRREWDAFDPYCDQLILTVAGPVADPLDRVVGVYRLMGRQAARAGIGFYGAAEYDLALIEAAPRESLELGRSCIAAEHRGGAGVHLLWQALAEHVLERDIEILFGAASFPGSDPGPHVEALSFLHRRHLAPPDLRVRARAERLLAMEMLPAEAIDPARALAAIPPLIKAYLRLGGLVGEGAVVDRAFNTVDVCLVVDTARMKAQARAFYARARSGAR